MRASETGGGTEESSSKTTDDIATALHHVDLPKLADAQVIDYDSETNTVTAVRTADRPPLLEIL